MDLKTPKVSVIIPTYNSGRTLGECLASVLGVDYPKEDLEVLVVDDGSTDDTKKVVEELAGKDRILKYLFQKNSGPATARNTGIRKAAGEIILLTDSDCIVQGGWIGKILGALDGSDVAGGSLIPASSATVWEEFEQARRDRLYGKTKKFVEALPSCNLAFRKNVWKQVGGFDEDYKYPSFEDYDFCRRAADHGFRILYDPEIPVVHKHSATLRGIIRRALMHGRESILYRKKRGESSILAWQAKLLFKALIVPYTTITRYNIKHMPASLLYEAATVIGQQQGIARYGLGWAKG